MKNIIQFIKGIIIGIAAIIPGLSGGTLSIIFGIYHRFVDGVTNFFKHPIKVLKDLSLYIISILIGALLCVVLINHFYTSEPVITTMLFIGLIIGGIPLIYKEAKKEKLSYKNYLIFFIIIIIVIASAFINPNKSNDRIPNLFIKFILGNICAFTLVVPGVSGSMLLMALGYYNYLIKTGSLGVTSLVTLEFNIFLKCFIELLPVIIGLMIGIFYVSKLVSFLFKKYRHLTYSAILGLLISSLFPIIKEMNMEGVSLSDYIIGGVLFLIGIYSVFYLEKAGDDTSFILNAYRKKVILSKKK